MEETPISSKEKKIALLSGLILGTINILTLLGIFYLAPKLLESHVFSIIQTGVGVVLIILFCLEIRKRIGGNWSFREALSLNFIMLFSSALMIFFFTMVLGRFIDPSYYPKMREIALTKYDSVIKKVGADKGPDVTEMRIKLSEGLDKQFYPSIIDVLKSICFMAIGYFIGALILAAIFKKKRPDALVEQTGDLSAL